MGRTKPIGAQAPFLSGHSLTRWVLYICGIFTLILGVHLMLRSSFGPPPWDTAIVHLADLLSVTLGVSALIIQGVIITFVMIMRRSWVYAASGVSVVLISVAFDFWDLLVLKSWLPSSLAGQLIAFFGGVVLLSMGLAWVLLTQLKALAVDELMRYFMVLFKTESVWKTRGLVESLALGLGVLFGWLATGDFGVIKGGTVFITVALPVLLSFQIRLFFPFFKYFNVI